MPFMDDWNLRLSGSGDRLAAGLLGDLGFGADIEFTRAVACVMRLSDLQQVNAYFWVWIDSYWA